MMPEYTANYNLIKPGYDETADIKVINENMDTLDTAIKAVEDKTANAPDNSVSDNAIGERTPNASLVPTSPGTGKLGQVLSWVTNRIKAITGKANWWDDPAKSLQQLADDHAAHLADYASFITNNAVAHNSIYRGKYLGSSVTAEQYLAISTGAFTDLYIGDYWTIGGVNYRIAAFDYYYNTGDTACTSHHVVIVPDTQLYAHVMNDTNITTGGYIGSKMYTEGLIQAKTKIKADFSGHVVNHRKYLCNAATDGIASGGAWFDSEVELMNEVMVYGTIVNGHATYGLYNIGTEKTQLPLFALNPRMINTRQHYWLRDVSSASDFAYVNSYGIASATSASGARGVRPAFSIS